MVSEFTQRVIDIIASIPPGKVMSYGSVARIAGSPRAARQVVRILHTQTKKHNIPWHRVVNSQGKIAIKDEFGAKMQEDLLTQEGVTVIDRCVDLDEFGLPLN